MTKKEKKTLIIVLIVALVFVYFAFFYGFKTHTYHIGNQTPNDFSNATETLTPEEIEYYENRVLFEVNYFSNQNQNGIELQELKINYFNDSDLSMQSSLSTGMQYVGNYEISNNVVVKTKEQAQNYVVDDLFYYETTAVNGNVITYNGGNLATVLNRNTKLIVKIDNKPYLLQLTACEENYFLFFLISGYYYGYDDIFVDAMNVVRTNSKGFGDYYVKIDLSFYFTVFAYDELSNKWIDENISKQVFTDAIIKFHYDINGATDYSQSMFNQVECDTQWSYFKQTINFDSNGGTGTMASQVMDNYKSQKINKNIFQKNGYTFSYWTIKNEEGVFNTGDIYLDEAFFTPHLTQNSTITLMANWTSEAFTINFNANGGTGTMANQIFTNNISQTINANEFTREGYEFIGWNIDNRTGLIIPDEVNLKIRMVSAFEYRIEFDDEDCGDFLLINNTRNIILIALWLEEEIVDGDYLGTYSFDNGSITIGEQQIIEEFIYEQETYYNTSIYNLDDVTFEIQFDVFNSEDDVIYKILVCEYENASVLLSISDGYGSVIEVVRAYKNS